MREWNKRLLVMGPTLLCVALWSASAPAAVEDDDDEPKYAPGLPAVIQASAERSIVRVDDDLQFVWGADSPDARIPAGPFTARWEGRLFTQAPGDYRFHIYAGGGRVEVKLGGKSLLIADSAAAGWHVSEPMKLGYAHTPLELTFQKTGGDAVLKFCWSGPQFAVEPVPDRHLFHDPKLTPSGAFDEGRNLVRALRCTACHEIPAERSRLPAPALTHLRDNVRPEWLVAHLTFRESEALAEPKAGAAAQLTRRMPHFALSVDDARAIAAYLVSESQASPAVKLPKVQADAPKTEVKPAAPLDPRAAEEEKRKKKPKARTDASAREGELLARSVGCLACHTVGSLGESGLFSGGDLSEIARKRPSEFFLRWLENPAALNADHRMPVFKLSKLERDDLTVYLATLRASANPSPPATLPQGVGGGKRREGEAPAEPSLVKRGRELVAAQRCAACHRLPGEKQPALASAKLLEKIAGLPNAGEQTCLGAPDAAKPRPGYRLDEARRAAIASYLNSVAVPAKGERPALDGQFVLQERNCTACHARGLGMGLADDAPRITAVEPELLPVQAALLPPSLNGVGDKLSEAALEAAVLLKHDPLRPWLRVRMPKFPLADEELAALKKHLVDHDRIPDLPPPAETASAGDDETAQRLAARRLVTADGFGCTSCHKIGNAEPAGITNIAAHGTDLTMLGERIRKPWFDRWVRNPARIIPRMEMPAIQLPVKGVMHDDVNQQLAAVWKVLNEPGFTPPLPNPVRIVRARNVPGLKERASILTDNFTIDGKTYDSAIVIGLPNRHNILFDLETNRLAAWWTGDTGLERTKGKSWYWEPGGAMVLRIDEDRPKAPESSATLLTSELEFGYGTAEHVLPGSEGQNGAVLDSLEHTATGARVSYRVGPYRVRQVFEPLGGGDSKSPAGFRRTFEIDIASYNNDYKSLSGDQRATAYLKLFQVDEKLFKPDGHALVAPHLPGKPRIELIDSSGRAKADQTSLYAFAGTVPGDKVVRYVVEYTADLPLDTFPVDIPAMPNPPAVKIDVVPGFEAVQLPLGIAEMPTGLAWRKDGSLVFTSLKGRVIAAKDTDGDGLEDQLQPVSDDLAAPYGIAVAEEEGKEVLDVINKYALLRLFDDDADGFYERSVVAASGWGHTDDYHDWAVGLPRVPGDKLGYFVGLPCQQDDRVPAKAALRGQGLKLLERTPTKDDPRRFSVEPFCGGLRFPMGLAVNKAGDLFASDNQGNYNPFNEINHLVPGKRYGFINKLEAKPGFTPPVESPALELPHPWTRSVNGICFLDTPPTVRERREAKGLAGDLFGPFEGHLLGCEFNYRSLFRMTLEKVDGVYQGAAFPLNEFPGEGQATFEGPTVCEIAPDGDLYVGNLQDSGWGGGRNTGSLVRLRPAGNLPAGIADIRAEADGFTLTFTQPVDQRAAADRASYTVEMFRRISTPQYGGNDVDRQGVKVQKAAPADDGRSVRLTVDKWKPGFVYEFHLVNLAGDAKFFPAEGYYTMKRVPRP